MQGLAGLVSELDDRLPRTELPKEGDDIRIVRGPTRAIWITFAVIAALVLGLGLLVLRPAADRCPFEDSICAIAHLDIDALLLAVPDANLFDVLPAIDEIDPDDSLTLGDVLMLDGIRERDPSTLLSPAQIERVLRHLE